MSAADRERYSAWIAANVDGTGYGKCVETCEAMARAFPELEVRRGLFHDGAWGERTHAWTRAPDGEIVDPTGRQHPTGSVFPLDGDAYEDVTDLDDEEKMDRIPSGKCPNCGAACYRGEGICSQKCSEDYAAYLLGGRR